MKHPNPMTSTRKATIWQRWKAGSSMSAIAKEIAKPPATIFSYLWYHAGIEPSRRTRSVKALSLSERESISRGLASGQSMRAIAMLLGRSLQQSAGK
jgi:IS30 family transposase